MVSTLTRHPPVSTPSRRSRSSQPTLPYLAALASPLCTPLLPCSAKTQPMMRDLVGGPTLYDSCAVVRRSCRTLGDRSTRLRSFVAAAMMQRHSSASGCATDMASRIICRLWLERAHTVDIRDADNPGRVAFSIPQPSTCSALFPFLTAVS